MRPFLPANFQEHIACPLCKSELTWQSDACSCHTCGQQFRRRADGIWDFVIDHPPFMTHVLAEWQHGQDEYESWDAKLGDDLQQHLEGIEGVREIYTTEFHLAGDVLDVGGHQGRLRHFLPTDAQYLGVDPYTESFERLASQPNLVKAYPCLAQPCAFLRAQAERLPLKAELFDYVHMRSVLDHFFDPLLALLEAHRVLRPGGGLLLGLYARGGASSIPDRSGAELLFARLRKKLRDEGWTRTGIAALRRVFGMGDHDDHVWHPTYNDLLVLLERANFTVEKVHWVKPPFEHVVFILGRKSATHREFITRQTY